MKAPQGNSTPRTLVPEGTHVAICYQMVELGTQKESYKGQESEKYRVRLTWELPYEKMEDSDKPMAISKEYTFFMGDQANLRKDLEAWRGSKFTTEQANDFDIEVLFGKPCQLTVVHKTSAAGNVRDEVVSVSGISKGMQIPEQKNKNVVLSFESWNEEVFESLPKFIKEKITASPEYFEMKRVETVTEFPPKEDGPSPDFFAPQTDLEKEVKGTSEEPLF